MTTLDRLLAQTSRTFALSIPLLPDAVRRELQVAYLLFRVADTIEDEGDLPAAERVAGLRAMSALLASSAYERADRGRIADGAPSDISHRGYVELIEQARVVFEALAALDPEAQRIIIRHLRRTIDGMCAHLERTSEPTSIDDLRSYCYAVAGIVGEACTELFMRASPSLSRAGDELMTLAPFFGEGLQLVNILRDESVDSDEGRRYIPRDLARSDLFALATGSLRRAAVYVDALERAGAEPGVVAFNTLNLALALSTLRRVEEQGAGAKLTREEVAESLARVRKATQSARSVRPILEQAAGAPLFDAPLASPAVRVGSPRAGAIEARSPRTR